MQKLFQILTSFSMYNVHAFTHAYAYSYSYSYSYKQRQTQTLTHWSYGSKYEQIDEKCTKEIRKMVKKKKKRTTRLTCSTCQSRYNGT